MDNTTSVDLTLVNGEISPEMSENWLPLALLCSNAYQRNESNFLNVTNWSSEERVGWNEPGLRGYVFGDQNRGHLIVAIKGTSITLPFQTMDIIPTDDSDVREVVICIARLKVG